jgi:glycosyltransferase involved in cell wall biosynthesis
MLVEALRSIQGADEVILLDDGSSFDVLSVCGPELDRFPESSIRIYPKMPVDSRLVTARLGRVINQAVKDTPCDIITYLCDDDLFHPDWLNVARGFFGRHPDHFVRAKWGIFKDGETPGLEKLCPLGGNVDMTTGNFAHLKICSTTHGSLWNESTVAVHDAAFLEGVLTKHPLSSIQKLDVLAGWRRDHPHNMLKFTSGSRYGRDAKEVLSRKVLE